MVPNKMGGSNHAPILVCVLMLTEGVDAQWAGAPQYEPILAETGWKAKGLYMDYQEGKLQ